MVVRRASLAFSLLVASWGAALASSPASRFAEADALFAARENDAGNTEAAIAAYTELLPGISGADLAYAVQQIGRASLYLGEHLVPTNDRARRERIFKNCRDKAALLRGLAEFASHHSYWRLACNTLWLEHASLSDRLSELPTLKREFDELIDESLDVRPERGIDLRYQAGGVPRVLAMLYSSSLANLIRSDLPNLDKALEMARRALSSANFPGDPNWGINHYRNHRVKAEVLIALGRRAEALTLLAETIEEIDELIADDDLPEGLEPETKAERLAMLRLMGR